MKLIKIFIIALVAISCNNSNTNQQGVSKDSDTDYTQALARMNSEVHSVDVLEAQTSGSYTYLKLKENDKEYWAAITAQEVTVGGKYYYQSAMEMKDFKSKSLDKVFESIWFIEGFSANQPVVTELQTKELDENHNHTAAQDSHEKISVESAKDGYTLAQVFQKKSELEGKEIVVKGQVVKVNTEIMKTNWVHIQDGTSFNNMFDLTITTNDELDFKLGDVVSFKGKLSLNKDFGYGYKYDFLLENAVLL
jgi:hypothetical protein